MATKEFLAFLDADDMMCRGQLRRQLTVFRSDPKLAAVISNYRNFDERGDYRHTHFETCTGMLAATGLALPDGVVRIEPVVSNGLLVRENFSIASSGLYRRSAWVQAGGFDCNLRASEDFDLAYRVARVHPIAVLGSVGLRRRMHASNMSNQALRIAFYKVASRKKLLKAEPDHSLRSILRASVAKFELQYAKAIADSNQQGWVSAYGRALRQDPVAALRRWRVLARGLPLVGRLRAVRSEEGGSGE